MASSTPRQRRPAARSVQVAAAVVGNALEWYDFLVFGAFAVIISRLFFPAGNEYAALLLTTATFGVGFFMRPVGGVVLGLYADRCGRKAAMLVVILLMTVSMGLVGFAPTHAAIGLGAPLLILVARLLQGFATGGEYASATSFLVEVAPAGRRGFYGSWQMVGQGLAVLFGAVMGALLTRLLSPAAIDGWGWRVPFLFGLLIGPVGLFIRRHLAESEAFVEARAAAPPRLGTTLAAHLKPIVVCFGNVAFGTSAFYVILIYMPTFVRTQLNLPLDQAFLAQSIGVLGMVLVIPFFGALSDRIGRNMIMLVARLLFLALAYPLFFWLDAAPSFERLVIVQLVFCFLYGVNSGPSSTATAEQFATAGRSTGLGIAYNLAVTTFGGFAPFIVTWLIQATGSPLAPSYYLMVGSAVGVVSAVFLVERTWDARLPATVAEPA